MAKTITALKTDKSSVIGGARNTELKEKLNELSKTAPIEVSLVDIVKREPFQSRFPIDSATLDFITKSIERNGFDRLQPILLWETPEGLVLFDGFTRTLAAETAGRETVYAFKTDIFVNDDEVLAYMDSIQFGRRNLSSSYLLTAAAEFSPDKTRGAGSKKNQFAKAYGLKPTTAQHLLTVAAKASSVILERIKAEELTLRQAYMQIQESEKESRRAEPDEHSASEPFEGINMDVENVAPENSESSSPVMAPENSESSSPVMAPENSESNSPVMAPENSESNSPVMAPENSESSSPVMAPENSESNSPVMAPENEEEDSLLAKPFKDYIRLQREQTPDEIVQNMKKFLLVLSHYGRFDKSEIDNIIKHL